MNKLTVVAASLISAGLATVITVYAVEKQVLREIDERVDAEVKRSVEFLVDQGKAKPTQEYQDKQQHKALFGTPFQKSQISDLDEELGKNQKVRYDKIVQKQGYSSDSEVDTSVQITQVPATDEVCDTTPEIHTISAQDFIENESGFDQESISYFADGGVLDDHGELVIDYETLVGPGVPPFGLDSGEPHVVYIRNNKLQREYEVVRDEANAADILAQPGSG